LIDRAHLKDSVAGRWPINRDLGWATTFFDVVSERDIPVTAELSDAEIAFFDPARKCMARWTYPDIVHSFEPIQRLDYVFNTRDNPEAQLTVGDADLLHLMMQRAPQLRRKRALSARLVDSLYATVIYASLGLVAIAAIWVLRSAWH
jgi:hypothetical protein